MLWALSVIALAAMATTVVVSAALWRFQRGRGRDEAGQAALAQTGERLEKALRDEGARAREEAGSASRALREEVAATIRGFQDTWLKSNAEEHALHRSELQTFEARLGDNVAALVRRADDMALSVAQGIEKIGAAAADQQARLHELLDTRLAALRQDQAASARSIREEVLVALGENLAATIVRIGDAQKERLGAQVAEIRQVSVQHDQAQREWRGAVESSLQAMRADAADSARTLRGEVGSTLKGLSDTLRASSVEASQRQRERLEDVAKEIAALTARSDHLQERLRSTVEQRLEAVREENARKLDEIRKTVDEQLQGTLERRLGDSFKLVSERLEQVHQGLGEMQTLASGVGDLRRLLVNVKVRGTWGEVQLGSLLEHVLSPEQYVRNAQTKAGSAERVEFAIRLPGRGDDGSEVLLPIDAMFPYEDYERLVVVTEQGDRSSIEAALHQLEMRVRSRAKEISDKYLNPPQTTDFAVMFLPTEGLYAEVLRRPGILEQIQRDHRVTLAGPTTLGAMLNALQMGFRTLAIQKRSSEVWVLLEAVKTEVERYGAALDKLQKKLHEASSTVEDVAVRRRAIHRRLRQVGTLADGEMDAVLGISPETDGADLAEGE